MLTPFDFYRMSNATYFFKCANIFYLWFVVFYTIALEDFKKDDEQEHSLRHLYAEGVWTDQCQFSLVGLGLRMQKVMVANFADNWHLEVIFPPSFAGP